MKAFSNAQYCIPTHRPAGYSPGIMSNYCNIFTCNVSIYAPRKHRACCRNVYWLRHSSRHSISHIRIAVHLHSFEREKPTHGYGTGWSRIVDPNFISLHRILQNLT